MNNVSANRSLHPVLWVAAVAVIVLAITGIAAMTGALPSSKSAEAEDIPQPVAATPTPQAVSAVEAPVAKPAPKPAVKHVERRRVETVARNDRVDDVPPPPPVCRDCGRIESIQRMVKEGDGSGVGAAAGGALGGVLGHQVGDGSGRTLATIAGVVGGAMLGNHVEKQRKQTVSYKTIVRYDDGTSGVFNSPTEQGFREGERVRVVNGELRPE
jgi:uncharacterized protein YcfJ